MLKNAIFKKINSYIKYLNTSPLFIGIVMIMLNVGSKYVTIELSKTQEEYLRNTLGRQILIFAIAFTATKDIILSLILTSVFYILTMHLFNENSSFCIIPQEYRKYKDILDLNNDNIVTADEIKKAQEILEKAKKQENEKRMIETMNNFKIMV